ncbi:phage tail protein [Mesorhizobium sp. ES1-4]|uniref:phage tail protein n=1 Tax=Mesorhizobium sp. ES1-4 TaxID=2876627 RepID=UPI001CCFC8C5|nr:phage tail protein [Mesorhizobium sp. ES1-4]MBZ9794318.1 phage tail protein [Mesorhizobium sp. ES1-4]
MFWNIILAVLSFAAQLIFAPKPQNAKPKSLEDFQAPTGEEGRSIPVFFGTNDDQSPNSTWHGDLKKDAIKGARRYGFFGPRQVLGYKYRLGMQLSVCHGVPDYVLRVTVGDKLAWKGKSAGGRITINKSKLFGGDQSEGGIQGDVDICMGAPDQPRNDYLQAKLSEKISAFRGVFTVVLRQVYLGTSNYIKPWELRVQRIMKRSDGSAQWYPEKAAIPAAVADASEKGRSFDAGASSSFRGFDTNGNWGVIGLGTTVHIWDVTDGSHRTVTYTADLTLGGHVYVTSDDELVVRASGSTTSLVFYGLDNLSIRQTIDLTPYWPLDTAQFNSGFAASEVTVGDTKYLFFQVAPYIAGFRGPYLMLEKASEAGNWSVHDYAHSDNATIAGYTSLSVGRQYAYLCSGTNAIGLVDWTAGFAETLVTPPGIGSRTVYTATYLPATDQVFVVYNDGLLAVYNADLTSLIRSATPVSSSFLNSDVAGITNRMLSGSTAILVNRDGRINKVYLVDLTTLSLLSTIDIYPTSDYVNKDLVNNCAAFNEVNGGLFVAPQPGQLASFWPIFAEAYDMNPAHIIRECLTDPVWGLGWHDDDIDDASFTYSADTFYSEGMGLSLKWYREEEIGEFVSTTVLPCIDAYLYGSRKTGKFVLKPVRDDYDIDLIPILTEDDVIEFTEIKRRQPSEAISSVVVKYNNREKRKVGAHRVTNTAQAMQATKVQPPATRDYPGINVPALAIRVAQRDVIALGSGLISGRIVANRKASVLNPGDPFRMVSARHRLSGEVMRVANQRFGDGRSNKIGLGILQDVFKLPAAPLVDDGTSGGGWVPPSTAPLPVAPRMVAEMPYRELRQMMGAADLAATLGSNPDAGVLQIAGASPTPDAANALIEVDAGSGYAETGTPLDFAPGAFLAGATAIDATAITVTGAIDLDVAELGTLAIIIGSTPRTSEIVRVDAIVGNTLTIARGFLDTVPQEHAEGASVVFFDDISNTDFEIYTAGDTVSVKLLTVTGVDTLDPSAAPADTVEFDSRAIRPLRPANVQVEGIGYGPLEVPELTDFAVTWANRDRLAELSPVPGWTDADVAAEAGATTIIEVLDPTGTSVVTTHAGLSGTTYSVPLASLGGNGSGFIQVGAERDGYREWQAHRIEVVVGYGLVLDGEPITLDGETLFLGA